MLTVPAVPADGVELDQEEAYEGGACTALFRHPTLLSVVAQCCLASTASLAPDA